MTDPTDATARKLLHRMFDAAVASVDPAEVLVAHLPARPAGRCVVVGAGKAAAGMAAAVESAWPDVALSGVVVAPYGHLVPTGRIEVLQAAHPVPDAQSEVAARRILAAVGGLGPDDLVLALISGGGSSLMALPADGITLEDKRIVNRLLLSSGLDIKIMNAVRRRLSAIKGGKLAAAAAPARVVTLAISDVPGDDPLDIASAPTVPDPGAELPLLDLMARLGGELPEAVARRLSAPVPSAGPLPRIDFRLIARPSLALQAAEAVAARAGLKAVVLGDAIQGEALDVGVSMAALARSMPGPIVLLSGGETTVTLGRAQPGRGGRNTEFLLSLALALEGFAGVWALAADTDGLDGAGPAAGALLGPDTLARAEALGIDAHAHLLAHDSGSFFERLGDLVITGPTGTNVNDFRAILVPGAVAP
jgi:hydroxypyruvate reductase